MTDITALHALADERGITIDRISCPKSKSMSLSMNGSCFIGIDKDCTGSEELVLTAHELGHCETGAFYNRYSKYNVISKLEYKADKWAVQELVPYDELMSAVEKGYTEKWQLAELFGVTEQLIERATYIYKAMYS
jgi:hypothetical protein